MSLLHRYLQGDHSPGKPGKVRKFQSGQGKWKKSGEVKSAEIWLFVQLKYQHHKTITSMHK